MFIGYARVSKGDDQSTAAQKCALTDAGCERPVEAAYMFGFKEPAARFWRQALPSAAL